MEGVDELGETERSKREHNDCQDVRASYQRDKITAMGASQGKANKSKASAVSTPKAEMNGRGKSTLHAIFECEQLLENGETNHDNNGDQQQDVFLELDEIDGESENISVFGEDEYDGLQSWPTQSANCNNNTQNHFEGTANPYVETSKKPFDLESQRKGEFQQEIMMRKSADNTNNSSGSVPIPKASMDSQFPKLFREVSERRPSVQFMDDELLPSKKRPVRKLSPASASFQAGSYQSGTLRRSTFANVYEENSPSHSSQPRRGSMPQNLDRNQLGRSSKKKFTVVNYGNVGREASETLPTGKESVTVLELLDEEGTVSTPSIQVSDYEKDGQDEPSVQEVRNIGGGRRLSILHINPNIPELDIKGVGVDDHDDEVDGQQSVAVDIEDLTKCNASCEKKSRHIWAMVSRGQDYGQRKKDRLVNKDGTMNIRPARISKRNYRFMLDLFTTLLDLQWRYVWMLFAVAFVASWFGFGLLWWLIAWIHGDFEPRTGQSPPPCVDNLEGFASALLYSIETQHTIGYGSRALSTECPFAFLILITQSLLGVIVQCIMAGVVFAKLAKPKNRAETVMFSNKANICLEDGEYCLVFRVGDMRRSQLVGCILRAFLVRRHITQEGRVIPFHTSHLHVQAECEEHDQSLFLAWPTRIIHRIAPDSPLWKVGEEELLREHFEIIVILEATIESSGMTTQIRASYLPSEILWGQTFLPLLTVQKSNAQVWVDYSNFHKTEPQDNMPEMSAMMYELRSGVKGSKSRCGSCRSNGSLSMRSRIDSCYQGSRHHMSFCDTS